MEAAVIRQMLVDYMDEKLTELQDAIGIKDGNAIKALGHKIKGNSGSLAIGLEHINELGKEIEAKADKWDEIGDVVDRLKAEIDQLKIEDEPEEPEA